MVVPYDGLTKDEQLAKSCEEIDRETKAIYEGTFSYDNVFVKVDIVVWNRGGWDLYEVKSSNSVKEHYWDDVGSILLKLDILFSDKGIMEHDLIVFTV